MRCSGLVVSVVLLGGCGSPAMLALSSWDGRTLETGAEFEENLHTHDAQVYDLSDGAHVLATIDGEQHDVPRSSETGLGALMAPVYKIDLPLPMMPQKISIAVTGDDVPGVTMTFPAPFEMTPIASPVSRSQPFPGLDIEPPLDMFSTFFQVSGTCLTNGTVENQLDVLSEVMENLDASGSCDLTLEVSKSLDTSNGDSTGEGIQRRSVTFTSTP